VCNPIGQAIFAPITVFAVKDRVLGHNPLAVIFIRQKRIIKINYSHPKINNVSLPFTL
jgi:uncharacterized metal-binding protein